MCALMYHILYNVLDYWSFNKWANNGAEFTEEQYAKFRKISVIALLTPLSIIALLITIISLIRSKLG